MKNCLTSCAEAPKIQCDCYCVCCAELLGNKQESEESGSESDEDAESDADEQAPDSMSVWPPNLCTPCQTYIDRLHVL